MRPSSPSRIVRPAVPGVPARFVRSTAASLTEPRAAILPNCPVPIVTGIGRQGVGMREAHSAVLRAMSTERWGGGTYPVIVATVSRGGRHES